MAFTPFIESDQPTMAAFNEKFSAAISAAIDGALDVGIKVEVGSYVGTGTYGSSNPTSLTFDFVPKLIILECNSNIKDIPYSVILIRDNPFVRNVIQTNSGALSTSTLRITWGENMVSWFSEFNAEYQMNSSQYGGLPYFYVAIG